MHICAKQVLDLDHTVFQLQFIFNFFLQIGHNVLGVWFLALKTF
jgi:hypothetical protein